MKVNVKARFRVRLSVLQLWFESGSGQGEDFDDSMTNINSGLVYQYDEHKLRFSIPICVGSFGSEESTSSGG